MSTWGRKSCIWAFAVGNEFVFRHLFQIIGYIECFLYKVAISIIIYGCLKCASQFCVYCMSFEVISTMSVCSYVLPGSPSHFLCPLHERWHHFAPVCSYVCLPVSLPVCPAHFNVFICLLKQVVHLFPQTLVLHQALVLGC